MLFRSGIGLGIIDVDNWVLYYVLIFGLASLCAVGFSSKPVVKFYDFFVEGSWKIFCWLLDRFFDFLGLLSIPVNAVKDATLNFIGAQAGGKTEAKAEDK